MNTWDIDVDGEHIVVTIRCEIGVCRVVHIPIRGQSAYLRRMYLSGELSVADASSHVAKWMLMTAIR